MACALLETVSLHSGTVCRVEVGSTCVEQSPVSRAQHRVSSGQQETECSSKHRLKALGSLEETDD